MASKNEAKTSDAKDAKGNQAVVDLRRKINALEARILRLERHFDLQAGAGDAKRG